MSSNPIDAVITWVNGNDPDHQKKRALWQPRSGADAPNAIIPTRFADDGEIYYCLISILHYAPFIQNIFIVTDNQHPKHLNAIAAAAPNTQIRVIDHQEIFRGYENYLPSFNSTTIETLLYRINDLSEHFIYFNDDFFLNAPVTVNDFFRAGQPVIYGKQQSTIPTLVKHKLKRTTQRLLHQPSQVSYLYKQAKSAQLIGSPIFIRVGHTPRALRKSTFEQFFSQHPMLLEQQLVHRFRHPEQFHAIALAHLLDRLYNRAILLPDPPQFYLKPSSDLQRQLQLPDCEDIKFGCIQSLDLFTATDRQLIKSHLFRKFAASLPQALESILRSTHGNS